MDNSAEPHIFEQGLPWKITVNGSTLWTELDSYQRGIARLSTPVEEMEDVQDSLLSRGAVVVAEVNRDEGIFFPALRFLSLTSDGIRAVLRFRVEDEVDKIQRRDAYRVRILLDGRVRSGTEFHARHEALVRDLSETGIRVRFSNSDHALMEKSEVLIAFSSSVLGSMSLKGKVRWLVKRMSGYESGIEFVDPELDEIVRLRNYLWQLQRERNLT